jgi:amino acid adenylation domain-containing protein
MSVRAENYTDQEIQLPTATTRALRALANQHKLTLNTVIQGAWALLLNRYSGDEDIVFGVTVSGRPPSIAGVESVLGPFINTLPMRVRISAGKTLIEWLKELQVLQAELFQYEYSPLVDIQGWTEVRRGLPLFESMLAFENYPKDVSLRDHALLQGVSIHSVGQTNYPLTVAALPGEELRLLLMYDQARFDGAVVDRMLRQFRMLLETFTAAPYERLSAMARLTDEEQRLCKTWNETEVDHRDDSCLHELFEAQAERTPDAVAVVSPSSGFEQQDGECGHLTYAELNRQANRLAHYLRKKGVGPDSVVAVAPGRTAEMIVMPLGILKTGGAYLPVDRQNPAARIIYMLRNAKAALLLVGAGVTASELQPPINATNHASWEVLSFDEIGGEAGCEPTNNPETASLSANLAYVMYTSGSTGRPKGVAMRHRSLTNLMHWQSRATVLTEPVRTLQFASLGFDVSCQEILFTLSSGGALVLTSEDTRRDAAALLRLLDEASIERVFLPFVALQHMAEVAADRNVVSSRQLREVITAGEKLQITPQIRRFFSMLDCCVLHNQYGPTECHVVTAHTLNREPETWVALPPVGRPIDNTAIHILDRRGQPAPIGVAGELYIGGTALARGYFNQPGLTAERFIPDSFSIEPGQRLYRTGDLARYQPGGDIEFLGRVDQQVKIRGILIEPGEVEAALAQHPEVREAVVLAREDSPGKRIMVSYVVPARNPDVNLNDVRRFLTNKLPDYMIPSAFVILEALPLLPNGKLDRRALPAPERGGLQQEDEFVAPRNHIEETLAGIWAQVLGISQVGIYDNFFDLGGHSMLATRAMSRIHEAFHTELPLRHLFEQPTVSALAQIIEKAETRGPEQPVPRMRPVPRGAHRVQMSSSGDMTLPDSLTNEENE